MEDGVYRGRPVAAALGETQTGKEQVGIEFELLDFPGQHITYYGYFTEKALEITLRALRTAGWRGDDLADLSSIGGQEAPEVSLVVENETYEGRTTAKVKWVNSAGGIAMRAPLTGDKAKSFAQRMRGAVLAHSKASGKPPASRGGALPPEPPPLGDDDIPF